ncbi:MAG: DUF1587 domain-containing protein, partial [Myxococcota bacterium]|nr:DUF1587 domain-containing protein [Myxococcota bacterium]
MTKQARLPIARSKLYASISMLWVLGASGCMGQVGDTSGAGSDMGSGSGVQGGSGGGSGSSGASGTGGGSGGGNTSTTTIGTPPFAVSGQDVRLADGDPTTAACATKGETLVPFRVLTRLNRVEYDNTARDLLGDTSHTALSMLPADFGDGAFDNNAAALNIDPSLSSTYMQLAEAVAENAMAPNGPGRSLVLTCGTTDAGCARQVASG